MDQASSTSPSKSTTDPKSVPYKVNSRVWPSFLIGLFSALLLNLTFFPWNIGWCAWFCLVPWLFLVRTKARPWKVYWSAYFVGLAFFIPVLQWMRVADPRMVATWIALALYCAFYFVLAIGLLRWVDFTSGLPLGVTLPLVWVALEFVRAHALTGFAWYFLGHTQHDQLRLIQIADLAGVYGVSFLVAAANGLSFDLLWHFRVVRRLSGNENRPATRMSYLFLYSLIFGLAWAGIDRYGLWRTGQDSQRPGPLLAMLQGSVPQGVRNEGSSPGGDLQKNAILSMWAHYSRLCNLASIYNPDLIVWPETSFPGGWSQLSARYPAGKNPPKDWPEQLRWVQEQSRIMAFQWHSALLLGVNATVLEENDQETSYNSALLINHLGECKGRYDKIHRVPFGEYVPLKDSIPWMNMLSPYDFDYGVAAGTGNPQLVVKTQSGRPFQFGVTICYEDTDPSLNWIYGRKDNGNSFDFVVNISNDGWFDGTAEHEQHLAIARFRAIELRRGMIRAVNMGITSVIDGNGHILRPTQIPTPECLGILAVAPHLGPLAGLPWLPLLLRQDPVWDASESSFTDDLPGSEWYKYKKKPAVLLARVPIDSRTSWYAIWGDWLPWTCLFLLVLLGIQSRFRKKDKSE